MPATMLSLGCGAIRLAMALALGVALHVAWVVAFILGTSLGASQVTRSALWLAAPVVTAAGYAAGLTIRARGASALEWPFSHVFIVVLLACAAGAMAGRPIGPMFIGLGALAAGALSALALVVCTPCRRRTSDGG